MPSLSLRHFSCDFLRKKQERCRQDAIESIDGNMTSAVVEKAQADFALSLLEQAAERGHDAFLSPLSISLVLAMTYVGAVGNTAKQMKTVMAPGRFACFRYLLYSLYRHER